MDADAWYAPYVAFARAWGVAGGYPDGTFRPESPVSRAELVKLLCAYFDRPGAAGETSFPDVPAGHWAADAIAYAAAQGWISGYPDGSFQPEQTVTRAETVKILNRGAGASGGRAGGTGDPFFGCPPDPLGPRGDPGGGPVKRSRCRRERLQRSPHDRAAAKQESPQRG